MSTALISCIPCSVQYLDECRSKDKLDPEKSLSCNLKISSFFCPWNAIWQTGSSFLDHKNKAKGGSMKHVYLYGGFQLHRFRGLRSCPWNWWNAVPPQYIGEPSPRGSRFLGNYVLSFKTLWCVRCYGRTSIPIPSLALPLVHVVPRGYVFPAPWRLIYIH